MYLAQKLPKLKLASLAELAVFIFLANFCQHASISLKEYYNKTQCWCKWFLVSVILWVLYKKKKKKKQNKNGTVLDISPFYISGSFFLDNHNYSITFRYIISQLIENHSMVGKITQFHSPIRLNF